MAHSGHPSALGRCPLFGGKADIFANVADPVSGGLVDSLAKPGGNITGFAVFDYDMGAKYVELLKEIAPFVTHVGVIRDPTNTANTGMLGAIQSAASTWVGPKGKTFG
jgi:putative ABC transport system substrate-binding protein